MADIKFIVGGYVRVERVIKGRYSHLTAPGIQLSL